MKDIESFEAWWGEQQIFAGAEQFKDVAKKAWLARTAVEADRAQRVPDAAAERERILGMLTRHDWSPSNIFRYYYPSVTGDWVDLRELRTLLASTPAPAQQEPVYCTYPACQSTGKTCLGACAKHAAHHQEPPHQERKPMTDEVVREGFAACGVGGINARLGFVEGVKFAERHYGIRE